MGVVGCEIVEGLRDCEAQRIAGQRTRSTEMPSAVPLWDSYRQKSRKRIEQDVYDRFFTSIEQRVTQRMEMILDAYRSGVAVQGIEIDKTDPPERVVEAFKDVYLEAYRQGCKGCTTYRPNEVTGAVLARNAFRREFADLAPQAERRMGANPHANGGLLLMVGGWFARVHWAQAALPLRARW